MTANPVIDAQRVLDFACAEQDRDRHGRVK
jgi:hypothetical protein